MIRHTILFFVFFNLVLTSAQAQSTTEIEPRAKEVLKSACDLLKDSQKIQFTGEITRELLLDDGQKITLSSQRWIAMQRPDKLKLYGKGDYNFVQLYFKDSRILLQDLMSKKYAFLDARETIDETFDMLAQEFAVVMPMADLLVSDPYQSLMATAKQGTYIGLHPVRGIQCHHLAFRAGVMDWQIWIDAGEKPLIRKFTITSITLPGEPDWTVEINDWDLNPTFNEATFSLTPPEYHEEISMKELIEQLRANQGEQDASSEQ